MAGFEFKLHIRQVFRFAGLLSAVIQVVAVVVVVLSVFIGPHSIGNLALLVWLCAVPFSFVAIMIETSSTVRVGSVEIKKGKLQEGDAEKILKAISE